MMAPPFAEHWLPWLDAPYRAALSQRGHALLVHGPQGVGQWELAQRLAARWLCEGAGDSATQQVPDPCGQCASCRLLQAGTHPDVRWAVPDALRAVLLGSASGTDDGERGEGSGGDEIKGKAAGRDVRVQDIRAAIDWTHQTSSRGRGKVLVVFPAERLNGVAANALLKTLEEPPAGVRLVLAGGDAHALLPTLRSRCQRVALALPDRTVALEWLASRGLPDAHALLSVAGGTPGEALRMAEDHWDAERLRRFPQAIREGHAEACSGLSVAQSIDLLQKLCMDALQCSLGLAPSYFPKASVPEGALPSALRDGWKRLQDAARHADHPWSAALKVDALVMEARSWWPVSSDASRPRR